MASTKETTKTTYMAIVTYKLPGGGCKTGQFTGYIGTDKDKVVQSALSQADQFRGPSYRYCDVEVVIGEATHKAFLPVKYELVEV